MEARGDIPDLLVTAAVARWTVNRIEDRANRPQRQEFTNFFRPQQPPSQPSAGKVPT